MNVVKVECRNCDAEAAEFASGYAIGEEITVQGMQDYLDVNFVALCGNCSTRSWRVLEVKHVSDHTAVRV